MERGGKSLLQGSKFKFDSTTTHCSIESCYFCVRRKDIPCTWKTDQAPLGALVPKKLLHIAGEAERRAHSIYLPQAASLPVEPKGQPLSSFHSLKGPFYAVSFLKRYQVQRPCLPCLQSLSPMSVIPSLYSIPNGSYPMNCFLVPIWWFFRMRSKKMEGETPHLFSVFAPHWWVARSAVKSQRLLPCLLDMYSWTNYGILIAELVKEGWE